MKQRGAGSRIPTLVKYFDKTFNTNLLIPNHEHEHDVPGNAQCKENRRQNLVDITVFAGADVADVILHHHWTPPVRYVVRMVQDLEYAVLVTIMI